jgi:hypothetical protein
MQLKWERLCFNQVAINAITNTQDVIEGFDVNVRCSVAKALADERGDHVDHGAVVIAMGLFGYPSLGGDVWGSRF